MMFYPQLNNELNAWPKFICFVVERFFIAVSDVCIPALFQVVVGRNEGWVMFSFLLCRKKVVILQPENGNYSIAGYLIVVGGKSGQHRATILPNGKVLLRGSNSKCHRK